MTSEREASAPPDRERPAEGIIVPAKKINAEIATPFIR
jgi:hypothetical protein